MKNTLVILFILVFVSAHSQENTKNSPHNKTPNEESSFNMVEYKVENGKEVSFRVGNWVFATKDSITFCHYKNGLLHGKMRVIYYKSKTFSDIMYKKGKRHGSYIIYNSEFANIISFKIYKKDVLVEEKKIIYKGI